MVTKNSEAPIATNNQGFGVSNLSRATDMKSIANNQLQFHNTKFNYMEMSGQIWLTASEVGQALEYSDDKAVQRIYSRHSDEFTENMSGVVKMTTPKGMQESRVFSLRGAHLVAMFSRTTVAKEFRRWVLDILDREVAHSPIAKQFTDEELQSLCWLWKNSVRMASHIADVEPLLRVAEHRLALEFYSMPREYSHNMNVSRALLERETMHVPVNSFTNDNWRVLNNLRIGKGIH